MFSVVSLQPNASRILIDEWGLKPEEARGMVDRGFRIYNTDGKMVTEVKLEGGKYGAERLMFHRQALHE